MREPDMTSSSTTIEKNRTIDSLAPTTRARHRRLWHVRLRVLRSHAGLRNARYICQLRLFIYDLVGNMGCGARRRSDCRSSRTGGMKMVPNRLTAGAALLRGHHLHEGTLGTA